MTDRGGRDRGLVLVAGASGALGQRVARRLLAQGVPVRALGRNAERLATLAAAGAEVVTGDLRDEAVAARACNGARQIVSTLNNVMGTGASSPVVVDRPAYRALASAAARAGVQRWVHVSVFGIGPDNPVDYFRVKHGVDEIVTTSGVPWVLVQPSAFMETWVTTLLGDGMRRDGKATLFGRGDRVSNFVAMDDVAGRFNEKVGRLMSLGYWSATTDVRCDGWEETARRFGVSPMSVPEYLAAERAAGAAA